MSEAGQKPSPVFVRQATGLVREIGPWASMMAVILLVTSGFPPYMVSLMYTAPGANWPVALFVAFVASLIVGGMFTVIGASMPRSGADYVFTTRALNPFIGFINYWGVNIAYILNLGILAFFASSYLGYFLSGLAAFYHSDSLTNIGVFVTSPAPSLGLAVVFIAVTTGISILRPRYAWRFILLIGIITLVTTAVMFFGLSSISSTKFSSAYDSFMSNSSAYTSVIQSGGVTPPSSSFLATAAALPLAWFFYTWYNMSLGWSGELKNSKRSMPITIIGALIITAVYYILFAILITRAFGQPFLDNWSALAATGSTPVPGVGGFVPFFALLVNGNVLLYVVMFIAIWVPVIFAFAPLIIAQTRYIFAWSFDRILPDWFASVNERTHTPVIATIVVAAGGILSAFLMDYLPNSGEFATLSYAVFSFGFIIPAIAAIIFPFRRRQLYDANFVPKKRFLIPVLSWLGLGSFIYLVYSTYLSYRSGALPINTFTVEMYVPMYGIGILILIAGYLKNRKSGIPLELSFKEIPPE